MGEEDNTSTDDEEEDGMDDMEVEWPDLVFLSPDSLQILPDLVTKSLNLVTLYGGRAKRRPVSP